MNIGCLVHWSGDGGCGGGEKSFSSQIQLLLCLGVLWLSLGFDKKNYNLILMHLCSFVNSSFHWNQFNTRSAAPRKQCFQGLHTFSELSPDLVLKDFYCT